MRDWVRGIDIGGGCGSRSWEPTNHFRSSLGASVQALVVAVGAVLFLDTPEIITGSTGRNDIAVAVTAAVTVVLVRFMLVRSYGLRIASVAKRSVAVRSFSAIQTEVPNSTGSGAELIRPEDGAIRHPFRRASGS